MLFSNSKLLMILTFTLVISSCTSDNSATHDKTRAKVPAKPQLFKNQLRALEKAKNTQKVIDEGVLKRRKKIDEE